DTPTSPAVEQVAEVGGTAAMQAEVNSLITAGTANQVVLGTDGFISAEETNTFIIDVDSSYPLLSLLTMIAPSPDWFVGIHDVSLVDGEGDWIPQLVIDLNSYDAGTENGSGLSLNNAPTTPQGLIAALDAAVPNGALFGSGSIARLTITRIPPPACDVADITADGACDVVAGGDGAITLSDFSCYLSEWASASPSADITLFGVCDVAVGGGDGVDLSDFSCYLAEWSQGCP
ncbi:MAG: spondin domain-containing protein, partial [Planctomycetota bacterium]